MKPPRRSSASSSSKFRGGGSRWKKTAEAGGKRDLAGKRRFGEKLAPTGPERIVGFYRHASKPGIAGMIDPADRRLRPDLVVPPEFSMDAAHGELVVVEVERDRKFGPQTARVIERLGPAEGVKAISIIAIAAQQIPLAFTEAALLEARSAKEVTEPGARSDLRDLPLVTIDGADARDFDDAVYAAPDPDPGNKGGWHLVVAIADVAHYVKSGGALDRDAEKRGNSVYLPDRVVPMLPEELSNNLCSLKPNVPRACIAAHIWIDAKGAILHSRFVRGLMRSRARLTYEQVQKAYDGAPDAATAPLMETVIRPLYKAYDALLWARRQRGTVDLDMPEYKVRLGENGEIASIDQRLRLGSHMLIEEFMIAANVAAATALEKSGLCLYRVHAPPPEEKLETLGQFLGPFGFKVAKGQKIDPKFFMQILGRVAGKPEAPVINEMILRSQSQAIYSPDNAGHFGLNLARYAHFTSPIRRYSDLVVHRALIKALKLPGHEIDALDERSAGRLEAIGEHLSATERRAAMAEREATARYTAQFLAPRIGETFPGTVAGAVRAGLFIRLTGFGAEGFVSLTSMQDDYYHFDEQRSTFTGRRTGRRFRLGDPVTVTLVQADAMKDRLSLDIVAGGVVGAADSSAQEERRHFEKDRAKKDRFGEKPWRKRGDEFQKRKDFSEEDKFRKPVPKRDEQSGRKSEDGRHFRAPDLETRKPSSGRPDMAHSARKGSEHRRGAEARDTLSGDVAVNEQRSGRNFVKRAFRGIGIGDREAFDIAQNRPPKERSASAPRARQEDGVRQNRSKTDPQGRSDRPLRQRKDGDRPYRDRSERKPFAAHETQAFGKERPAGNFRRRAERPGDDHRGDFRPRRTADENASGRFERRPPRENAALLRDRKEDRPGRSEGHKNSGDRKPFVSGGKNRPFKDAPRGEFSKRAEAGDRSRGDDFRPRRSDGENSRRPFERRPQRNADEGRRNTRDDGRYQPGADRKVFAAAGKALPFKGDRGGRFRKNPGENEGNFKPRRSEGAGPEGRFEKRPFQEDRRARGIPHDDKRKPFGDRKNFMSGGRKASSSKDGRNTDFRERADRDSGGRNFKARGPERERPQANFKPRPAGSPARGAPKAGWRAKKPDDTEE